MSKKMKGVALVSSPYVPYLDGSKSNSKHQALWQEYQELHKETMAARNKLETMKQKKLILSAEVRFLRRRYKYLLEKKVEHPSQVQKQVETSKQKKKANEKNYMRKEANQRKQTSVPEVNHQERIFVAKATHQRNPVPVLDLNQKDRMQNRKEALSIYPIPVFQRSHFAKEFTFLSPRPVLDLNQNVSTPRNASLPFDLNQTEMTHTGREDVRQNRAPIFDLNQISGEEELQEENYGEPPRMEEQKIFVTRNGAEEQLNDLKLSVCRNVGNGPNRAVKRKVSWLDQVALKV